MEMKLQKKFVDSVGSVVRLVAAVAAVLVLWTPACVAQPQPVAKVNDRIVTQYELDEAYNEIFPAASFHGGITPEKRAKYHERAINKVVEDELLYQEALRRGLKVDEAVIEEDILKTIEKVGGKRPYEQALKNAGMTEDEYASKLRRRRLVERLRKVAIEEEATVSDEEARKYYDENEKTYMMPQSWRLRHILISVPPNALPEEWEAKKVRAEEALKKIKDGEAMAAVAWDYSDDPYRVKGGDLGMVHSGRLVAELEMAVRELDVGETSDVVTSIYGYHIVRVEAKTEPQQLEYDMVADKIKTTLSQERRLKLEEELLKKLKAEATIEVY
jgi:peptidyl-prolyl cis-trans isomerase C